MAYTKEQWDRAKGYYEAGISLSGIKEKTNIARNTISQRAKKEHWEHSKNVDYIEAKELIATKKGTVLDKREQVALDCADEVADDKLRRANLVYGGVEKAVKKMNEIIESGYVEDKINTGDGMQKFEKRALNTSDIKSAIDGYDKASVTLKVSDRFANSQVVINTQTNLQNNNVQLTTEEAKKAALDLGVPLSALL